MNEIDKLALAVLFHDIGKVMVRAGVAEGKPHFKAGSDWIRERFPGDCVEMAATVAEHHHALKKESRWSDSSVWAVETNLSLAAFWADNWAAGERGVGREIDEQASAWIAEARLANILGKVRLSGCGGAPPTYWPIAPLVRDAVAFPVPEGKGKQEDYRALWNGFERAFEEQLEHGLDVASALGLLERYLSCVPDFTLVRYAHDTQENPDISLYDHLRTSAAIAVALVRHLSAEDPAAWESGEVHPFLKHPHKDPSRKPFLLISGNLSGIQRILYGISQKFALKQLRARSVYLELICKEAQAVLLEALGLSPASVLFSGGGRFLILAGNTPQAAASLASLDRELNGALRATHGSRLSIEFAHIPLGPGELAGDWAAALASLGALAESAKYKPAVTDWRDFLTARMPGQLSSECKVCHADDHPLETYDGGDGEPVGLCPSCAALTEFGKALRTARWLVGSDAPADGALQVFGGVAPGRPAWLRPSGERAPSDAAYRLGSSQEEPSPAGCLPLDMGSYTVPNLQELGDYAARSSARLLGVLRMDADNLGAIFREGLPAGLMTPSRYAALSRTFARFFQTAVPTLCGDPRQAGIDLPPPWDNRGEEAVMLVYAGGDDLFLLGAWDAVARTALRVRHAFSRYHGANPSLGVSGGLVLGQPSHPVADLASLGEGAEAHAKASPGKGALALFYGGMSRAWRRIARGEDEGFLEVLREIGQFAKTSGEGLVLAEKISHGDTRSLWALVQEMASQEGGEAKTWNLPRLRYLLSRKEGVGRHRDRIIESAEGDRAHLFEMALAWLELSLRKRKED